jgi:anthranilate phosphoribosyltransferase
MDSISPLPEHPFAQFVRILGKGPNLSRAMTAEETEQAARMIMRGEVEAAQLGAFLCLMRVKTETPEEVSGFVRGIRSELTIPLEGPTVDLDWASWAGKARQLPYFLLAALALAKAGIKVFMHGAENHTAGRIYTSQALAALGRSPATSLDQAADQLAEQNFTYVTLSTISPRLQQLMELRHLLGVRSPLHTVGRKLNIFNAPAQILSVTHPPYLPVHQQAAVLLKQPKMAIFKGDGGEVERRPHKPCTVYWVRDGVSSSEDWPPLITDQIPAKDEVMDLSRLAALWDGREKTPYALEAILGTMAVALVLVGRAEDQDSAYRLAHEIWNQR